MKESETFYTIHFDGSCYPNPYGVAKGGFVIRKGDEVLFSKSFTVDERNTSNNVAEYSALIVALVYLFENGLASEKVRVVGDSKMVISQMFIWKKKKYKGLYAPYAVICKRIIDEFSDINGAWVPREENTEADSLSTQKETPVINVFKEALKVHKPTLF